MGIGEKRDTTTDLGGENLGSTRFVVYSEDSTQKNVSFARCLRSPWAG